MARLKVRKRQPARVEVGCGNYYIEPFDESGEDMAGEQ
jgi:hypothetical protein